MNFTQAQVERLLAGKRMVLTVPKKEGEQFCPEYKKNEGVSVRRYSPLSNSIKFQVGRDYAVMQKGKTAYACDAGHICFPLKKELGKGKSVACNLDHKGKSWLMLPLRFVVKKITSKNKDWLLEVEKK